MPDKKYAVLSYLNSRNFGDEIQSLAARNCMPRVDTEIARENLKTFASPVKHVLLMNGWFSHDPENEFPPSSDIIPVYYSFHITPSARDFFTTPACIAHFKKWQPIGCRDRGTMRLLQNKGIDSFYSKCLTLTFSRREKEPRNGKIFLVDTSAFVLPKNIKSTAVITTHKHNQDHLGGEWKTQQAQNLLNRYKDDARLVITGKLHCALPCQALGIPTIYLENSGHKPEYRTSIYADIGGIIHRQAPYPEIYRCILQSRYSQLKKRLQNCNFADFLPLREKEGDLIDVSQEAKRMRQELKNLFLKHLVA